jgi:hypothetical protein
MNYRTKQTLKHILGVRLHLVGVISCVELALLGQVPESSGGWLVCPPVGVSLRPARGGGKGGPGQRSSHRCG